MGQTDDFSTAMALRFVLSMRAWDRLGLKIDIKQVWGAAYAYMGQTRLCVNYVKPQRKKGVVEKWKKKF